MTKKENMAKMGRIVSMDLRIFLRKLYKKLRKKTDLDSIPAEQVISNIGSNLIYVMDAAARSVENNASLGRDMGRGYAVSLLYGVARACVSMGIPVSEIFDDIKMKAEKDGEELRLKYQEGISEREKIK